MPTTKKKTAKKKTRPDLGGCPCAGRHLEKFIQPAVLTVLAERPLHGYLILQRLGEMPMFKAQLPDSTGVYRFLKAMEDRGLVVSAWDVSRSGPAKKLFRLTGAGRRCLRNWAATLAGYHEQIGRMLRMVRRAGLSAGFKG